MKKTIFLTAIVAFFAATFLTTSCTDSKKGPTCYNSAGLDTGAHTIYLNGNTLSILPLIHDSLTVVSVTSDSVTIKSLSLGGQTLTGKLDKNDCNKIILDSLIIGSGPTDTIKIPTTLPLPGGVVKIWSVRAGGSGTITANGATTTLNIAKAKTNITVAGIDLTNIPSPPIVSTISLKGTFLKVH